MLRDWIPRSRWFYLSAGTLSLSTYYLWWDRHQSKLIQRLYESEAHSQYGQMPLPPHQEPMRLTVLVAGRDRWECVERKRLFRKHVARILMKAGVDWEVVEVEEGRMGRRVNELKLADADHKEVGFVERGPVLEAISRIWSGHSGSGDDNNNSTDTSELVNMVIGGRRPPRDGLVSLDQQSFDSVLKGLITDPPIEPLIPQQSTGSWWRWPFSRNGTGQKETKQPRLTRDKISLVDIPTPTSTLARLSRFLDNRGQTIAICEQAMSAIKAISASNGSSSNSKP
jgi:hypothetical protein